MSEATTIRTHDGTRREVAVFFALALVVLALGAWQRDLFDADEGRYASVAWNMVASGDWVTPQLEGMPFMDKPPLVYWVQAVLYLGFGRHEILARAPTLLAGALWAMFIFLFARTWGSSRRAGWCAGLLAVTSAAGMIGSRVGPQMDMPLAAAVAGALWAGWCGVTRGGVRAAAGLGLAIGLGLLVKGPLVVAVPGLVACAWMFAGIDPVRVRGLFLAPIAWGVALLVAAPWYVLVEIAQPGWLGHFIGYEHFGRFNTGDHRAFHPFWFYVPIALIYMAPWTSLAWGGWGRAVQGAPWSRRALGFVVWSPWSPTPYREALPLPQPGARAGRVVPAGRLAWSWFVVAFVLYSLATRKLLNYLLPASAPLFILLGALLERRIRDGLAMPWRLPMLLGGGAVVGGALVMAGLWFPFRTGTLPTSIEAPRWAALGPWFLAAGLLLACGALGAARWSTSTGRAAILLLGAAAAWWTLDAGLARVSSLGSARELATALAAFEPGPDAAAGRTAPLLVSYKRYPQGLGFYSAPEVLIAGGTPDAPAQREIVVRYARPYWSPQAGVPEPGGDLAGRGARLLTQEAFEVLWGGPARVVAILRWAEIAPLGAHLLSGPYAGAGRTDLYLATNLPPNER